MLSSTFVILYYSVNCFPFIILLKVTLWQSRISQNTTGFKSIGLFPPTPIVKMLNSWVFFADSDCKVCICIDLRNIPWEISSCLKVCLILRTCCLDAFCQASLQIIICFISGVCCMDKQIAFNYWLNFPKCNGFEVSSWGCHLCVGVFPLHSMLPRLPLYLK